MMEMQKLKVGVQTGALYHAWTNDEEFLDTQFKRFKECGFDCVDYNIDNFLAGKEIKSGEGSEFYNWEMEEICEYLRPTKEAAERNGICFSQAHAPFPLYVEGNEEISEYMLMVMDKVIAACSYLNCPAVVAHPYTHPDKELERQINLGMYRRMIPAAKKYGVKICLENLFDNSAKVIREGACSLADEACWYIDTLNNEAGENVFGFCFDVGHANLLGKNIREYLRKIGKRLTVLHIHDNDGVHDIHQIPYTQTLGWSRGQHTDWEGFLEGLRDIGYRGALSFETFREVVLAPDELADDFLRLTSAIGRYFSRRLLEERE